MTDFSAEFVAPAWLSAVAAAAPDVPSAVLATIGLSAQWALPVGAPCGLLPSSGGVVSADAAAIDSFIENGIVLVPVYQGAPDAIFSRIWYLDGSKGSDSITIFGSVISLPGTVPALPVSIASSIGPSTTINSALATGISSGVLPIAVGNATKTYYKMRGFQPGAMVFETWTSVNFPDPTNPSGLPIQDVTIAGIQYPDT